MPNIGDRVQHKKTNNIGTVVAYGHWIINDVYLTTIKVRLSKEQGEKSIVEDVVSEWISLDEQSISEPVSTSLLTFS
jgi:hypothetical protein